MLALCIFISCERKQTNKIIYDSNKTACVEYELLKNKQINGPVEYYDKDRKEIMRACLGKIKEIDKNESKNIVLVIYPKSGTDSVFCKKYHRDENDFNLLTLSFSKKFNELWFSKRGTDVITIIKWNNDKYETSSYSGP